MSDGAPPSYDPQRLEARRQSVWRERDAFRTPAIADGRRRVYIKPSAPFTSGDIHIGHVRSYSIGDAYARFRRARGDAVLFAFGFDAFGLPAELGAIAAGESPSEWVGRCSQRMTAQLQRLGYSFDWERAFVSSDAVMYRWSQWLFLVLLEAGLVYRGTGNVDWCDTCQTTLATIQVEDGLCWRCHQPVRLVERPQWYLRISAYLQENDRRLAELAEGGIWDDVALASQRFVLGRVDGAEVDLDGGGGVSLTVFTPHADAVALARFVLISPRHPDVDRWADTTEVHDRLEDLRSGGLQRSARDAGAIPLIETGHSLPAPAGGQPLPVLISPVVDGRFGATAVLGIPAHDHTDALVAQRLGLDDGQAQAVAAANGAGDQAAAMASVAGAAGAQPEPGGAIPGLRGAVRYRANDFSISRQRSWGTPIPIVYCQRCAIVPVPADQLPVRLPRDLEPTGAGNPLAERADFAEVTCPTCGAPARRETDTLDCHFDALWLWLPACVAREDRERPVGEIFELEDLRAWLPSERVVAGSDSGNFVFDQRIVTKALRDLGPLSFLADGEPFAGCLFHEMVIRDGRKMSKHLGNVVEPDELVERFGADTVRLATLYAARPQRSLNWSDSAVLRCHRFLTQVWDYSQARLVRGAELGAVAAPAVADAGAEHPEPRADEDRETSADATEHLRRRLQKWCETAVQRTTDEMEQLEMHSAVRNVMRLFERVKDFEQRVIARRGQLGQADSEALIDALALLAQLLAPMAPHIAEELRLAFGHDDGVQTPWPGVSFGVPA
jgi:leucyl-tRNA synthetase